MKNEEASLSQNVAGSEETAWTHSSSAGEGKECVCVRVCVCVCGGGGGHPSHEGP